jgi:hypothetical protein
MQQVPVKVMLKAGADVQAYGAAALAIRFDATLVVGADTPAEDEGGHGAVRTYLQVNDDEGMCAWCLVCVAQQMLAGTLTTVEVV